MQTVSVIIMVDIIYTDRLKIVATMVSEKDEREVLRKGVRILYIPLSEAETLEYNRNWTDHEFVNPCMRITITQRKIA